MNRYYLFLPLHCFQSQLFLCHIVLFLPVPPTRAPFLYFPALTGNGFACHVTLVTGCVMDGILVRALFCLRHTAGWRRPATPPTPPLYTQTHTHTPTLPYLSHAATCSHHPTLLRIFSLSFPPISMAPRCCSFICWHFALLHHYLSSCCVTVGCRWSIIII